MENMMAATPISHYDNLELWETPNRSGIVVTVLDEAGALVKTLNILASNKISLTAI
jgi:prephenate dehydratase